MKYNNRIYIGAATMLFIVGAVYTMSSTDAQKADNNQASRYNTSTNVAAQRRDRIQIFYFHRSQRCSTCKSIGRFTGEVINEKFSEELAGGKIEFREVNVELLENKELAKKFKATGPSLYINNIKNGEDNIKQDVNVWRLIGNEVAYKNYFENIINDLL